MTGDNHGNTAPSTSLNLAHKGLAELTKPREEAGAEPGGLGAFGGNLGVFRTKAEQEAAAPPLWLCSSSQARVQP